MEVLILILILSIVQSLFGVGLLLFGTPLMLLMGHEYTEALMYLLPASAAISWSQVSDYRAEKLNGNYRHLFFVLCIPLLIFGMVIATQLDLKREIRFLVTFMLISAFILRTSSGLRTHLQEWMRKNLPGALISMGLIHGLSNMGGSILTPLASSLYKEKNKVLAAVSFDYAFMATIQLFFLIFLSREEIRSEFLIGPVIALLVRYLIGRRIFAFTTEVIYQRLLNGFILANALLLGINLIK